MKPLVNKFPRKAVIDVISLMMAIAAVIISLFSLEFSRDAARSSIAQIRPQLVMSCYKFKRSKDKITAKLHIDNIGQTTATIDDVRLVLYQDQILTKYYSYFQRAIIYKNASRETDIEIPVVYDLNGRKIDYAEKIQKDGGVILEVYFECREMPGLQFVDSILIPING